MKNVLLKSLFFQNWPANFFYYFFHLPDKCYIGLFFKTKICQLCPKFLTDLCYAWKLHGDAFVFFWIFSEPDVTLCYHCKYCNKSKPKLAWAHTQLDFPLGYWTWVKKHKLNHFGWKSTKIVQTHKINDSNVIFISIFRLTY